MCNPSPRTRQHKVKRNIAPLFVHYPARIAQHIAWHTGSTHYINPIKEIFMKKPYLLPSLLMATALLSGCAAELLSNSEKLIIVKGRPSQLADASEIAEPSARSVWRPARPADHQAGRGPVRL